MSCGCKQPFPSTGTRQLEVEPVRQFKRMPLERSPVQLGALANGDPISLRVADLSSGFDPATGLGYADGGTDQTATDTGFMITAKPPPPSSRFPWWLLLLGGAIYLAAKGTP